MTEKEAKKFVKHVAMLNPNYMDKNYIHKLVKKAKRLTDNDFRQQEES